MPTPWPALPHSVPTRAHGELQPGTGLLNAHHGVGRLLGGNGIGVVRVAFPIGSQSPTDIWSNLLDGIEPAAAGELVVRCTLDRFVGHPDWELAVGPDEGRRLLGSIARRPLRPARGLGDEHADDMGEAPHSLHHLRLVVHAITRLVDDRAAAVVRMASTGQPGAAGTLRATVAADSGRRSWAVLVEEATDDEWDLWCALNTRLVLEVAITTGRDALAVTADVRWAVEQRVMDLHRWRLRRAAEALRIP